MPQYHTGFHGIHTFLFSSLLYFQSGENEKSIISRSYNCLFRSNWQKFFYKLRKKMTVEDIGKKLQISDIFKKVDRNPNLNSNNTPYWTV